MTAKPFLIIALFLSFALLTTATASIAYTPKGGDHFSFYEVENLGNGTGNYAEYTERTITNGTEMVNGTIENGIVPVTYSFLWTFSNNTGGTNSGKLSGNFTYSPLTFLYVKGTDNQTGPYVWFCMNNSIPNGGTFYLLNTEMTVMSKNYSYFLSSANENVEAIYAQGSSSYPRNDVYGQFNAAYTWKAYFDPTSGYIIGYDYTEQDTNNTGNGFTLTDNLYINSASYSLTAVASGGNSDLLLIVIAVIIIVVIVIALYAVSIRRRPKRSSQSNVSPSTAPPKGPAIKCPYCGGLVYFGDKDIANCEYCGREVQKPSSDS